MPRLIVFVLIFLFGANCSKGQNFGVLPKIEKEKLLNDLDLLYQGLNKFHSGMYWYTPKDGVDLAFETTRNQLTEDLNVLEFHKLIAPLVALSHEDHTNIFLPDLVQEKVRHEFVFLPFTVVFLGTKLYCLKNASSYNSVPLEGKEIRAINGESVSSIVNNIGNLFATDGYIKRVKYSDLRGFNFALYHFYYYGQIKKYEIKFKGIEEPVLISSQSLNEIKQNLSNRYEVKNERENQKPVLEYKVINDSVAYMGIHSFNNDLIRTNTKEKKLKTFLQNSFRSIAENDISILIIDMSKNTGGSEGNEGLVYSYFGENYQKYKKVRAKAQKVILNTGTDEPIRLRTFGVLERYLMNKKTDDGSLERRQRIGKGLMAYKKEPRFRFHGETYVLISPLTYSGGSEFSNMMYSQGLATFVGQETGGGYYGNTSGYAKSLVLPHSKIEVKIPSLQFVMNVEPKIPFGRGVIPHYEVIPSFQSYVEGENVYLKYVLEHLIDQ